MSIQGGPSVPRIVPVGVIAAVWVLIAVLFPTTEPQPLAAGPIGGTGIDPIDGSEEASLDPSGTNVDTTAPSQGPAVTADSAAGGEGPADATAVGPDDAAGPAEPASGTTRGGLACQPGVRQIPVSTYAVPCMPAFSGDNGGATSRGVTADEIVIVERVFPETANSQAIAAVSTQAGVATDEQQNAIFREFTTYFNEHFELYGRTVRWVRYESRFGSSTDEIQGKGREGACLDADVIAQELGAFAVVGERAGAVSGPMAECAAQRGVMTLNGAAYFPETFYRELHPYAWAFTMECERISAQLAEYIGKRLLGKPARFAGDDGLRSTTRSFATYVPNNDEYQRCADVTDDVLRRDFGIEPGSRYNYTLDVSRFPDEAARGVVQFKSDGATSVILACDPISAIFLTQSATQQAYYPEWLLLGVAAQDTDLYAQLYDQRQVDGHLFGMSQLSATQRVVGPGSEPGRLYEHITGKRMVDGASGGYSGLMLVYNFLQAAGPALTPDAVAAGARAMPPGGAPDYSLGYWSFADGPDGTPGAGDHTAVDDSREVYWTRTKVSPETGEPGTFVETYGGKRFRNGEWPAEDPPIYPGS